MSQQPNNVELHLLRPDGTFIMSQGPYAGLRAKIMGQGRIVKSNQVEVHHHEPLVPYYFDPGNAVQPPPDPIAAQEQLNTAKAVQVDEKKELNVEKFVVSTPVVANPWADIQIQVDDEDEIVEAEVVEERELTPAEVNQATELDPSELLEMLITRDLTEASMTPEEFNALKLSKRQLYRLYEQIYGQTTNKPQVAAAITAILKRANANPSNYARVTKAIKRIKESTT